MTSQSRAPQNRVREAKAILARSLFNEFTDSNWSRSDMLEFVNELLDLIIRANSPLEPELMIDPESGFPTRAAFQALVLHELNSEGPPRRPIILLIRTSQNDDNLVLASAIRHRLRRTDVVVPLKPTMIGALLNAKLEHVDPLVERLKELVSARLGSSEGVRIASHALSEGDTVRSIFLALLRSLGPVPPPAEEQALVGRNNRRDE